MTTYVLGMFDDHLRKVVTTPTFFFGSPNSQVVTFLNTAVWARFVGAVSIQQPDRVYIQLGDNDLAKMWIPMVLEAYEKVVYRVLRLCPRAVVVLGQAFPRYSPYVYCRWRGPPFDWTRHHGARERFNRFLEETFVNCPGLRILDSSFAIPRRTHRPDGAQLNERGNTALVAVLNGMWDNAQNRRLQNRQQENVANARDKAKQSGRCRKGEKSILRPNMKPSKLQPATVTVTVGDSPGSNSANPIVLEDDTPRMSPGMCEDSQPVMASSEREKANGQPSRSDIGLGKRKENTIGDVLDQVDGDGKKRKLEPLDHGNADNRKTDKEEETRAKIKTLINNIPTDKDAVFAISLDWRVVDQSLIENRIKPWVTLKIIEYIGKKDPTLTDLICQKVMDQSQPQNILNDVARVFHSDEKAEAFVVKMWKLLIYETEAKKAGLVK